GAGDVEADQIGIFALVKIGDRLVDGEGLGTAGLDRQEQSRGGIEQELFYLRQYLLGPRDRRRDIEDGVGKLRVVEFLDVLYAGVFAGDDAAPRIEIGPGERDAHSAVRKNRRRAQAEIDLAAERRREAAVRLHDDKLDLFGIAQQILGNLMSHIDLETDELAVVVDIRKRRRGAVGGDD